MNDNLSFKNVSFESFSMIVSVIHEVIPQISFRCYIYQNGGVTITILTTNTSYSSKKIRRIHACTHQRPQRKQAQYAEVLIRASRLKKVMLDKGKIQELKGKFLDDLHNNAFSGTNRKDAVEHIEYYLKIIDPIKLPNVDHDKLRVVGFPISLAGDAQRCWREDGYCNGENLPEAYRIRNSLHYQDLEWYEALEDNELKDEALRNKAIIEGLISDDESRNDCWKRWKSHEIYYHNYDEGEYKNETHEEGHELCGIKTRKVPVCQIKRYKMIKYSFNNKEEYVSVKEDEYDDLTIKNEKACRAYQEIFWMMDEG
ncbi:hypothetical protein Tco_0856569 [Tanacetum coccineum]|uniref:Uncharacterized protein n=1 Tax=Tanacetum coccineum TaxID=301880 RepID=A0ABQ5B5U6_9ASTR